MPWRSQRIVCKSVCIGAGVGQGTKVLEGTGIGRWLGPSNPTGRSLPTRRTRSRSEMFLSPAGQVVPCPVGRLIRAASTRCFMPISIGLITAKSPNSMRTTVGWLDIRGRYRCFSRVTRRVHRQPVGAATSRSIRAWTRRCVRSHSSRKPRKLYSWDGCAMIGVARSPGSAAPPTHDGSKNGLNGSKGLYALKCGVG